MRTTFDAAPLFRSSIGFDRLWDAIENARRVAPIDNWPPYDIVKTGEDDYRIAMAVAGFAPDDLTVTQEQDMLLVMGRKPAATEEGGQYLYHGMAGRSFRRRFQLADHVTVVRADLINGLLTIELKRELPDEMKPRRIAIAQGGAPRQAEPAPIATGKLAA